MRRNFSVKILCCLAVCLLCSACKDPQEKHAHYLEKGDKFYAEADFIKARLEYKNAAKALPSSAQAIYKLGLVEEAEGNFQSALSAFLTAEQQDPALLPVLLKLSEFFVIAQQYEEASKRLEATLALDPQNAQAHALKASIFLNGKLFRQARRSVDSALASDPSNIIAHSVLSGIYMAQGNYDEALRVLDEAIALTPQELSFYLLKATIYSEQDNIDGVVGVYEQVFKRFPEQIRFRHDLAKILIEFSQIEAAKKAYEDAIKAFPDNHDAKLKLLQFVESQDGIVRAKQAVDGFIDAAPDQKIFTLWLADLYVRNDEHEQAIATLKSVIDTDPNDWIGLNAQTTLAEIQLNRGDMAFALDLIDVVLAKEVNNMDARFLKANLAFFQGDHRKAIADFREILNNAPSFLRASRMLSEVLLMQGRIDLAIDTVLQALKHHPSDNATLVRLAQLYALRGEEDTALKVLQKITELNPSSALAWESVARIALEKGEMSTAERAIERLTELGGQDIMAQFLGAKLDFQAGRPDAAIAQFKDIIRADINAPIAAHALSALVEASDAAQEYKSVERFLSSLNAHTPASLTVLGAVQLELGQQQAAEESLRKAIAKQPQNQTPYISLARILLQQALPLKAVEILDAAENAEPAGIDAPMMKAEILIGQARIDDAIAIYERVLERNENVEAAANNMAQIIADFKYQDSAALEKARLTAERFINSDNADYLDTLGWVYYRSNLEVQALPILRKAVDLQAPANPQIDYHYGAVLMANGDHAAAEAYLQRATAAPSTPYEGLEVAKSLLARLKQSKEE